MQWIAEEFLGHFMNRRYRQVVRVEASSQGAEESVGSTQKEQVLIARVLLLHKGMRMSNVKQNYSEDISLSCFQETFFF